MYPKIDFLYLSEPDMIAAGVLDAERCVAVCEETFSLLGEGDYLMGGPNHNNHGMSIVFPKETKFPNIGRPDAVRSHAPISRTFRCLRQSVRLEPRN